MRFHRFVSNRYNYLKLIKEVIFKTKKLSKNMIKLDKKWQNKKIRKIFEKSIDFYKIPLYNKKALWEQSKKVHWKVNKKSFKKPSGNVLENTWSKNN